MRYEFFIGPLNLEEIYPGIVERSSFFYTEDYYVYYALRNGKEVRVLPHGTGWKILGREEYLDEHEPVQSRKMLIEHVWEPPGILNQGEWLSLLIEGDKIIGSYIGEVNKDSLGRRHSIHSSIKINPQYQGRGLCRGFAQFSYGKLLSEFAVDYICIAVVSTFEEGACRCYIRAAKNLGLYTFGSLGGEENYLYREIEDCNLGFLDDLIFTVAPELDEVMIEFSAM